MNFKWESSYKLWLKAAQTGADLLWRTRQNARLDVDQRLPDGSYLSRIYASTSDRRNQRKGMVVRVIDYRLKDVKDAEPIYRLITPSWTPPRLPPKNWRPCTTSVGRSKPPWTN